MARVPPEKRKHPHSYSSGSDMPRPTLLPADHIVRRKVAKKPRVDETRRNEPSTPSTENWVPSLPTRDSQISEIPEQNMDRLPAESVQLNARTVNMLRWKQFKQDLSAEHLAVNLVIQKISRETASAKASSTAATPPNSAKASTTAKTPTTAEASTPAKAAQHRAQPQESERTTEQPQHVDIPQEAARVTLEMSLSNFPKQNHTIFHKVFSVADPSEGQQWILWFTTSVNDLPSGSPEDLIVAMKRKEGILPQKGWFTVFKLRKDDYDLSSNETEVLAQTLNTIIERLPLSIGYEHISVRRLLVNTAIRVAFPKTRGILTSPTIDLFPPSNPTDFVNIQHRRLEVVFRDVLPTFSSKRPTWSSKKVYVTTGTIKEDAIIPPTELGITYSLSQTLEDWMSQEEPEDYEPTTRERMLALDLIKFVIAKLYLRISTKSDVDDFVTQLIKPFLKSHKPSRKTDAEPEPETVDTEMAELETAEPEMAEPEMAEPEMAEHTASQQLDEGETNLPPVTQRGVKKKSKRQPWSPFFGFSLGKTRRYIVPTAIIKQSFPGIHQITFPPSTECHDHMIATINNIWTLSDLNFLEVWEKLCNAADMLFKDADLRSYPTSVQQPRIQQPRDRSKKYLPSARERVKKNVIHGIYFREEQRLLNLPIEQIRRENAESWKKISSCGQIDQKDPDYLIWFDQYAVNHRRELRRVPILRSKERGEESKDPFDISIDAAFPYVTYNKHNRIHVATNIVPVAAYLNHLCATHLPMVLPLVWLFDNDPTPEERTEFIERANHLYLIRLQMPYTRADRINAKWSEEVIREHRRQMRSGIATEAGCKSIKNAWSYLRRFHGPQAPLEIDNLRKLRAIIEQMDPNHDIPRIGKDQVPWPFEGGPIPEDMTWDIFCTIFADRLETLTQRCDKYYITTATVDTLIIALCYQTLHRHEPQWRDWLGMPISIYHRHPLSLSIGKQAHGFPMSTGMPADGYYESLADLDDKLINLDFGTWISNTGRKNWDAEADIIRDDFRRTLRAHNPPFWIKSFPPLPPALPKVQSRNSGWRPWSHEVEEFDSDVEDEDAVMDEPDIDIETMRDVDDDDANSDAAESPGSYSFGPAIQRAIYTDHYIEDVSSLDTPENSLTMVQLHGSRHSQDTQGRPHQSEVEPTEDQVPTRESPVLAPSEEVRPGTWTSANGVLRPEARNMTNLGATCWMSSILQIIHRTPKLRRLVRLDFPYTISTGRPVHDLFGPGYTEMDVSMLSGARNETMESIKELMVAMAWLFRQLDDGHDRLTQYPTKRTLDALYETDPRWTNENHDASEAFLYVLEQINIAADESLPVRDERPFHKIQREEEERFLSGRRIAKIQEDSISNWMAYTAEGHTNEVARTLITQVVRETPCAVKDCVGTTRSFEHSPIITLELPHVRNMKTVKLTSLLDDWGVDELDPSQGLKCPFSEAQGTDLHPPRCISYKKITQTSDLLVFHINRGTSEHAQGTEPRVDSTIVEVPETLNLAPWVHDKLSPSSLATQTSNITNPSMQYHAYAQLHYIPGATTNEGHWIAYIRLEATDDRWVLFDDLREYPIFEDPQTGISRGNLLSLVFYTRDRELSDDEHDDSRMMNKEVGAQTQEEMAEETSPREGGPSTGTPSEFLSSIILRISKGDSNVVQDLQRLHLMVTNLEEGQRAAESSEMADRQFLARQIKKVMTLLDEFEEAAEASLRNFKKRKGKISNDLQAKLRTLSVESSDSQEE